MRVLVLAKSPVPGRCKTRLQTRWSAEQAAALAEAALADTLDTVSRVGVTREVVLDGDPGPWLPQGFVVSAQRPGTHAERIAAALSDRTEPCLLIGMDTPQVSVEQLQQGLEPLTAKGSSFGHAADGGWWALGLSSPAASAHLVLGVPTSTPTTGALQEQALRAAGLAPVLLPVLRDVDLPQDADVVAALAPAGRFGRLVATLTEDAA